MLSKIICGLLLLGFLAFLVFTRPRNDPTDRRFVCTLPPELPPWYIDFRGGSGDNKEI